MSFSAILQVLKSHREAGWVFWHIEQMSMSIVNEHDFQQFLMNCILDLINVLPMLSTVCLMRNPCYYKSKP